jgi:RND family efflux transporter MFP subunit
MKPISLIFASFLFMTLLSCGSSSDEKTGTAPTDTEKVPVKLMPLKPEQVSTPITASGQFTTDDETYLSFKIGGVINRIYKKEGDAVRRGELLATLNLTEIDAQVAQAQLAYEKSKRDLERVENLYRDSVATLEQFQNARTGLDVATRQLEAARFNRSYAEIRAMSDGFILRKMASEGQVIGGGASVFQVNGARSSGWKLKVSVSDQAWTRIAIGDKATVSLDASTQTISATVSRKSEGVDAYTGSFMIELTIAPQSTVALASGLFGKATIQPARQETAWTIPYDALLDGDAQSGYVFVTDDKQKARQVRVRIASITNEHVIVSSGLDQAQYLIVSGSAYLKDGSSIQVQQ